VKKIRNFVGNIVKLFQTLIGMVSGIAGFWILYSKLAVEHDAPLHAAVDAPQRMVPTRAGKVSYHVESAAEGVPLVLVHSINAAASAFEMKPLFDFYRGKRPVYVLDLPGFGFSARDKRAYSPQLYSDALFDFLDQALEGPADVVAMSLSSEFVARAALMYSGVIRSIAMLSPTGFTFKRREIPSETMARARKRHRFLTFPLWRRALFDLISTRASIHWFLQRSFAGEANSELEEYSYATAHQPGADHAPLYFVSGLLFTPDARTVLYERLEIPVLVLYDQDAYVRFDTLDKLVAESDSWRSKRITPTAGLPHWEALAETTAALDAFWVGISDAPSKPAIQG
jgi:pimeloyl-ACP methyl ester carboxylesterase